MHSDPRTALFACTIYKEPETDAPKPRRARLAGRGHDLCSHALSKGGLVMLNWALTFLVVAIIAGVLGFSGFAGAASQIAQILFFVFLVLLIVSAVAAAVRGRPPV